MPIKPFSLYTKYHSSDHFSLAVRQTKSETKIIMRLSHETVNTRQIPQTFSILKKALPSVLKSTCYNDENYPFHKEVLRTEIGHLFEHILLEYLCLLKVSHGHDSVEMTGLTKWNWIRYPKGSFHITVSAGSEDMVVFAEAMKHTIVLTNTVLASAVPMPVIPAEQLYYQSLTTQVPLFKQAEVTIH